MSERFIYPHLEWLTTQADSVFLDVAPRPPEGFDDFVPSIDGIIAEFNEKDEELEAHVLLAHKLGKGVLLFLPIGKDPNELLPSLGPHPINEAEKRPSRAYWLNKTDQVGNEITVHRGAMREMKLKLWLASQAMRLGEAAPSDDFKVELANKKRYGGEADQLPLPGDKN